MGEPIDVLVLGELNLDVLVYGVAPPVLFGQAETTVSGAEIGLGSSGAITAAACRTAGLPTAICGVTGDDLIGALTRRLLEDAGIDAADVLVRDTTSTGMTVVLNDAGGDRALLTHPGAMAALRVDDVPTGLLERARHVHVSSLFLQDALQCGLGELFARLQGSGVSTSLDPGWDPREVWSISRELLSHVTYLLPNEAELLALSNVLGINAAGGTHGTEGPPVGDIARDIASLGPTVVVKRGSRGGLLADADHGWEVMGTPSEPIDTTGAGDNFDAGFLFAIRTGADPPAALSTAVAAGSVAVLGLGGTGRMATPAELIAARDNPRAQQLW